MRYEIEGNNLPVVICHLEEGEKIITEQGSMAWMTPNMKMETNSNGIGRAVARTFSGESFFQNIYYPCRGRGKGMIAFASSFPGTILPFEIEPGNEIIAQKKAFLAATEGVQLSTVFNKKIGAGLFGGEGFIMQKLSGDGLAFLEIDGSVMEYATTDKNATGTVELEKAKQLLLLTCIYYVLENETDKTLLQVKGTLDCFLKMDKISDKPGFSTGLTAEYYKRFLELDEELRYSVIISTYFHLFSFLSPKISSVVCSDDVHLDKFMEEKTVLFVNSKKIDVSSKTTDLSGLLYHQMCSIAENNAINHIPFTYRVTLLIDDITCYEDIPYFVYWIEYGKGYGISITATLQSLEQLNCAYEETCIAILEHIDKLVFLSDDFLLCFDKQLSKYLEFKYGNGFLSELEDMTKEEIMVCITDKAYKILQRKENLWQ